MLGLGISANVNGLFALCNLLVLFEVSNCCVPTIPSTTTMAPVGNPTTTSIASSATTTQGTTATAETTMTMTTSQTTSMMTTSVTTSMMSTTVNPCATCGNNAIPQTPGPAPCLDMAFSTDCVNAAVVVNLVNGCSVPTFTCPTMANPLSYQMLLEDDPVIAVNDFSTINDDVQCMNGIFVMIGEKILQVQCSSSAV